MTNTQHAIMTESRSVVAQAESWGVLFEGTAENISDLNIFLDFGECIELSKLTEFTFEISMFYNM